MDPDKIDKIIKEKLESRKLQPSNSAWERLSVQLEEQPVQKRRGWFFYASIAASIVLLFTLAFQFLMNDNTTTKPKKEILVDVEDDKKLIDQKIEKIINEVPIEEAIVVNEESSKKQLSKSEKLINKEIAKQQTIVIKKKKSTPKNIKENIAIAKVDQAKTNLKNALEKVQKNHYQQDSNSSIKINSDDLLYAVSHSPKEVKAYYAKYNLTREDVLRTIKGELKKSNIKINPNTILAEVERSIGQEDFQNNFMRSLKTKISNIATVIASRND